MLLGPTLGNLIHLLWSEFSTALLMKQLAWTGPQTQGVPASACDLVFSYCACKHEVQCVYAPV